MAVAVIAIGCGNKSGSEATPAATDTVTRMVTKIDGPSVTPIVTSTITMLATAGGGWGELSVPCYHAVTSLAPGQSIKSMVADRSPALATALIAAGLDLDRDLQAIGAFECPNAGVCMYVAAHLAHPELLGDLIPTLAGGAAIPRGPNHWVGTLQTEHGPREIHLEAVPIQWPAQTPADEWSQQMTAATHIVFFGGVFGTDTAFDPLATLAAAPTALARVKSIESLLPDARGRCLVGALAAMDFKPGFELTGTRFALAAPSGHDDAVTRLVGAHRTIDLEVDFAVAPAPTEANVTQWIAETQQSVNATLGPIADSLAREPQMAALVELGRIVADRAFAHQLTPRGVALSWRTDRVPADALQQVSAKLAALTAP
jgi:hypothetical protein